MFIQLRELEDPRNISFLNSIFKITTPAGSKASYNIFYHGLKEGLFYLLLDGLDEIPPQDRGTIFQHMQRFHLEYPDCKIIISTRPEVNLANFEMFDVLRIDSMKKAQTLELIKKTPYYDSEKKDAFIDRMAGPLYEENVSFLSIPLLALLMLLTHSQYSETPSRATVFYKQAFDTLFRRHDASKGADSVDRTSPDFLSMYSVGFSAWCVFVRYRDTRYRSSSMIYRQKLSNLRRNARSMMWMVTKSYLTCLRVSV